MAVFDGSRQGEDAAAEAEWPCRFCGTPNRPRSSHCRSCGAERDDAASRSAGSVAPVAGASAPWGWRSAITAVLLAAAVVGAVAGYLRFRKSGETVTVAGFEWERAVEVQDHRTVREESWEGEVPAGAQIVARRRQVHHTERQQVGTRKVKVGDVYQEQPVYRERPVYRRRIAYDLERWSVERTLKASGKGKSPRWPDIRLNLGEREGKRSESYVVVLQGRGLYRMKVPREQWLEMREGQIGNAVVHGSGDVLQLK